MRPQAPVPERAKRATRGGDPRGALTQTGADPVRARNLTRPCAQTLNGRYMVQSAPQTVPVGAAEKIQEEFTLLWDLCPVTARSRKAEVLHLRNLCGVTIRRWGSRGMKLFRLNAASARTILMYYRRRGL